MTTPTLLLLLAALIAFSYQSYAIVQNDRARYRAGTGAKHRRPGPATPWHRRSELDTFTRARPRPVQPLVSWGDDPATSTVIIHPVAQLRAIDLSVLQQLAAGPLAVAA